MVFHLKAETKRLGRSTGLRSAVIPTRIKAERKKIGGRIGDNVKMGLRMVTGWWFQRFFILLRTPA